MEWEEYYKQNSEMFYSNYWFDGSEEPDYEALRNYFKLRHEAKKAIDYQEEWSDLLRKDIERLRRNMTLDPHEKMGEEEMVSLDDFITMMRG
jgi:hypothetical protein